MLESPARGADPQGDAKGVGGRKPSASSPACIWSESSRQQGILQTPSLAWSLRFPIVVNRTDRVQPVQNTMTGHGMASLGMCADFGEAIIRSNLIAGRARDVEETDDGCG